MKRALDPEDLAAIVESDDLDRFSVREMVERFRAEAGMGDAAPDGLWACDPRTGAVTVFNPARAKRPHDHSAASAATAEKPCPICEGRTTGVLDVRPLSEGVTFINKNLFPCIYPHPQDGAAAAIAFGGEPLEHRTAKAATGLHFLQWTSSIHGRDWHNLSVEDGATVLSRTARLEAKLLTESADSMPETTAFNPGVQTFGFVSIIKNFGAAVGGSLVHGHQQIVHGNVLPAALRNDREFLLRTGVSFAEHLRDESEKSLTVLDMETARLTVPDFMKRPYQMMLFPKDTSKRFLFELTDAELADTARGWCDATRAIASLMPRLGKAPAYNILVHNGPSGGLYFEFLPYTQETGGYERLGMYVCHETPARAAADLRNFFQSTPS